LAMPTAGASADTATVAAAASAVILVAFIRTPETFRDSPY
jgi:hypothetical protein